MRRHVHALVLFPALCLLGCESPVRPAADASGLTQPLTSPSEGTAGDAPQRVEAAAVTGQPSAPASPQTEPQTPRPAARSSPARRSPDRRREIAADDPPDDDAPPADRPAEKRAAERRAAPNRQAEERQPEMPPSADAADARRSEHRGDEDERAGTSPLAVAAEPGPTEERGVDDPSADEELPEESPSPVAATDPPDPDADEEEASTTGSIPTTTEPASERSVPVPPPQGPADLTGLDAFPEDLRSSLDSVDGREGIPTQAAPPPAPAPPLASGPLPAPEIRPPPEDPVSLPAGPTAIREPTVGQACDCPYDIAADGNVCGDKSAWTRSQGLAPACYADGWGETAVAACPDAPVPPPAPGAADPTVTSFCSR